MDKQKECDITGVHVHQMKDIEEQYQLLNRERSRINEELAQHKAQEDKINQKLMSFAYLDEQIEWRTVLIERWGRDEVQPLSSIPRTTGFICLSGKDADQTTVRPDRKRCQKRLVKKGRMDINYLEEVQEEHKSSAYSGTQELCDMIESMVQRIQHGNKKRADEIKIFHELSNFMETKESYIAPEPSNIYWYSLQHKSKRAIEYSRYRLQHARSILVDYLETLKSEQTERQPRVRRLKAELQYMRRKINILNKKLENVDSMILKAKKRANKLGDRGN